MSVHGVSMTNALAMSVMVALVSASSSLHAGMPPLIEDAAKSWPDTSFAVILREDAMAAIHAAEHVVSAPLRWKGDDWLVAGSIVGISAACYVLDNDASKVVERNSSPFNDAVTRVAVEYGSGYVVIGLPLAMYASGLAFKEPWVRETAVVMGGTLVLTSAITTAGKIVIGRARPYAGRGHHFFKPFDARDAFMSFPSGHTTAAFAMSAVLAARIKNPWASVGLYGIAGAAALSRVYSNDHWVSDVVFTAAYTTAVAQSVVNWFEGRNSDEVYGWSVVPTPRGIGVVWRF